MFFSAKIDDREIHAFNLSDAEWNQLNNNPHLRLACCGKRAVCRTDIQGIRYFAHAQESNCKKNVRTSGNYLAVKLAIVDILLDRGWTVTTDKFTEQWSTDIYAENNKHKMCINIIVCDVPDVAHIERKDALFAKDGIKSLWFLKFDNTRLKSNIVQYNRKSNIFCLSKRRSEIFVGGMFKIEDHGDHKALGNVLELELSAFVQDFFVNRKIVRHKINSLQFNFEYMESSCSKCKAPMKHVLDLNIALPILDNPVRIGKVSHEKIKDNVLLTHINTYSKDHKFCFKLMSITEYTDKNYEYLNSIAHKCLNCSSVFRLKDIHKKTDLLPTGESDYFTSLMRSTFQGDKFGAIWIYD